MKAVCWLLVILIPLNLDFLTVHLGRYWIGGGPVKTDYAEIVTCHNENVIGYVIIGIFLDMAVPDA